MKAAALHAVTGIHEVLQVLERDEDEPLLEHPPPVHPYAKATRGPEAARSWPAADGGITHGWRPHEAFSHLAAIEAAARIILSERLAEVSG